MSSYHNKNFFIDVVFRSKGMNPRQQQMSILLLLHTDKKRKQGAEHAQETWGSYRILPLRLRSWHCVASPSSSSSPILLSP